MWRTPRRLEPGTSESKGTKDKHESIFKESRTKRNDTVTQRCGGIDKKIYWKDQQKEYSHEQRNPKG